METALPNKYSRLRPTLSPADTNARLRWVDQVARLMDSQFRLPGTNFRFGLDPILGFIPVVGELGTFAISAALIVTMMRHGASRKVVVLMVLNVLLDTIVGSIPLIGNLFDFAYKSNERNVRLLRRHYGEGRYQGSGKGIIAVVVLVLLGIFALVGWASYELLRWAWEYIQ
ncbi:DUF4112 domain-containing protein [Hymenobacter gummosus]|uniref:DUF4112 domain-containing protein n=1 Tax=Hymenobacter gummosus TaxID=1776032 RepID=A0A431U6D9_9BACT|nr:DUF4112 domain-containing protein [Hymenobacter gummosus]RTQ51603.1 DUF4112 domain-containing protein [Hymenobacter gummosus]